MKISWKLPNLSIKNVYAYIKQTQCSIITNTEKLSTSIARCFYENLNIPVFTPLHGV